MKEKYCFIVVNYNNSRLSISCVKSVLEQTLDNVDIIIVDNNSAIEEKQILQELEMQNNIDIIYLDENIGYFPALVKGQKLAYTKYNYTYLVLANNDLIFSPDFVVALSKLKLENNVMVVSPDIVTIDGIHQNPHFVHKLSFLRKLLYSLYYRHYNISLIMNFVLNALSLKRAKKNKPDYDKEQKIYLGFGACFILTRFFMSNVKYVDDKSFLMGEEQLLMRQVEVHYGIIYYVPALKVTHLDSATFKKMPSRFSYECEKRAYQLYKHYL